MPGRRRKVVPAAALTGKVWRRVRTAGRWCIGLVADYSLRSRVCTVGSRVPSLRRMMVGWARSVRRGEGGPVGH